MDGNKDYYAILGVHLTAEVAVIKAAYRALSLRYHPDTFSGSKEDAHRKMALINEAYEILSNPGSRKKYDQLRGDDTHDAGSFYDEEDSFDGNEDPQQEDWEVATTYNPDLEEINIKLNRTSKKLSYTFRAYLLVTKKFNEAEEIASQMEHAFMRVYFGVNEDILAFAKRLVLHGHKKAARELNKAVCVLGEAINAEQVIRQIAHKYKINYKTKLQEREEKIREREKRGKENREREKRGNFDLFGLSDPQKELVVKLARELENCGSSLHGSKNKWKIVRGDSVIHSLSLQVLTKDVQNHIKRYKKNDYT